MTSDAAARAVLTTDLPEGTWRAVPQSSTAMFTVRDKIVVTVRGTLPIRSGTVVLGHGGSLRQARVELDASAIDTGNPRRDRDLAKPALLNYTTYPTILVSAGPATLGPEGWDIAAAISAAGAACPLSVRVVPVESSTAGIRVRVIGRFDRKALRMRAPRFVIGRYIDIEVGLLLAAES